MPTANCTSCVLLFEGCKITSISLWPSPLVLATFSLQHLLHTCIFISPGLSSILCQSAISPVHHCTRIIICLTAASVHNHMPASLSHGLACQGPMPSQANKLLAQSISAPSHESCNICSTHTTLYKHARRQMPSAAWHRNQARNIYTTRHSTAKHGSQRAMGKPATPAIQLRNVLQRPYHRAALRRTAASSLESAAMRTVSPSVKIGQSIRRTKQQ